MNKNQFQKIILEKFTYRIVIVLIIFLNVIAANAQENRVNGTVKSGHDNLPIPGVSVLIKGTTTGTVTNQDGEYNIATPTDGILVFSFIGMKTQEITINGQTNINVSLEEETTGLDEVVIVGYGVQKKVNLSGAVDAIDSKELESRPITNLAQGLQGVAPNLNIDFVSGEPGQIL